MEGKPNKVKTESEISICLRDLVGKEHRLQMCSESEVSQLEIIVSRLWAIPQVFQRLMVGEGTLENVHALSAYSDQSDLPNSLLVMVLVCADAVKAALDKLNGACSETEALEILINLGTLGQRVGSDAVKTVALLLGDSRHSIRQAAIKTLVKIARRGDTDAMETLSAAMKEPSTRDAMVTSLKLIVEVGDEDAIFLMLSYLQSHRERVSAWDPETVVKFNTQTEYNVHRDERIVQALDRAGYDLGRLEEYTFNASLLKWKRHLEPRQEIHWEGEWRVGEPILGPRRNHIDQTAFPLTFILSFLQENNVGVCLAALDVLGHVAGKGNRLAIAAVASCLEDESDDVQWKAVEQLGLVIAAGDHSSILHAKKRLTHEHRRVRWAAQEALGQFIEKSS